MTRMDTQTAGRLRSVVSRDNALVKELRRAFTRGEPTEEGYCAIESVRIVEEAIRSGLRFKAVFFSETSRERANRLLPQLSPQIDTVLLPDAVFRSAVATESPQGVSALVKLRKHDLEDVLAAPLPLVVALAGLQDPGNLGTVVRSAEAFGATGVVAGEKTVSRFNAKSVRASAGSLFRVPFVNGELSSAFEAFRQHGLKVVATSSHNAKPVAQVDMTGPVALVIGSEGSGVPHEVLRQVDEIVTIPHSPKVESLNAGVAASILLYEISRQRAQAKEQE